MASISVVIDPAVLRELREQRMWTLGRLAKEGRRFANSIHENSGLAPATICRAEKGEPPRISPDTLRYLVGALQPSQTDLRRLLVGAEPPRALLRLCADAPAQPAEEQPTTLTATVAELNAVLAQVRALVDRSSLDGTASRQGDDVDRSEFIHRVIPAALGAGLVPWAGLERLSGAWHPGVDDTLVVAYEDMAGALWQAYSTAESRRSLLVAVGHQAGAVRAVLRQPMTPDQRRRLYEVSVGLHAEAGMLGLRLSELDLADGFFSLARTAAQDSGDDRLQAQALQVSTHLLSSVRYGGHGGNDELALTLVEQAAAHATNADAHTRADVLRRLAVQRALDGDDTGFQRALEQARQESARIDGSQTGFGARSGAFVSPYTLHHAAGIGCMALGRSSEALRELRAAAPGMTWAKAQLRADMARVWVQLGEPEQACAELTAALRFAVALHDRIGLVRIHGVRAGFPPEWADLSCVRALDERLRAVS